MDELVRQSQPSARVELCDANLAQLPEAIERPVYDRSKLSPGIVHIGLGNFHRAHQAWYLHRLMQVGLAHDWAIIGAGVRAYDAKMRHALRAQDCLTTLIELDPSGTSAEIIGSMIDYVPVEAGNGPLIAQMTDPAIRIVSLTVTEGGYYLDPATGAFDEHDGDMQHDAANPGTPCTVFGAIIAALKARRDAGTAPFSVLSCDNLIGNGAVTRQTIVSLARLSDAELADWINENAAFPNCMVDCIVPATGPEERALARSIGIDDEVPVTHENFRQWVIEDAFCAGRPALDKAGVTFTDDVHRYEAMKLRVLNAGHQVLANVGELLGVQTIAGCMTHPTIRPFFRRVMGAEVLAHVAPVPELTPEAYLDLIANRFANPEIRDTTRRVAFDGSSRHTGFLLPTIRDAVASDAPLDGLALVEALWARMCAGTREDGSTIEPNDPFWDDLTTAAHAARTDPTAWLAQTHIYGDVSSDRRFNEAFTRWLNLLWSEGTEATIGAYLENPTRSPALKT